MFQKTNLTATLLKSLNVLSLEVSCEGSTEGGQIVFTYVLFLG